MSFWMPSKFMKRWEKIRAKGRIRFILLNGVIYFGGWMFIFTRFIFPSIAEYLFGWKMSYLPMYESLILWLLMGLLWGISTWWLNEKSYLQEIDKVRIKDVSSSIRERENW
jgi:hypothetical protein